MAECQFAGAQPECLIPLRPAVFSVTGKRRAKMRHLHADLVVPPGQKLYFYKILYRILLLVRFQYPII